MRLYIWSESGKFYKAVADLTGRVCEQWEITEREYMAHKSATPK